VPCFNGVMRGGEDTARACARTPPHDWVWPWFPGGNACSLERAPLLTRAHGMSVADRGGGMQQPPLKGGVAVRGVHQPPL